MDAILQKIKADIISRPRISALILLTIVLTSTLLTLALATLMNMNAPYDKAVAELNAAHVWLHFDRERVGQRDIARIKTLPGVVESTGLRHSVTSRVQIRDIRVGVSIRAIPLDPPQVNRLLVQEGRHLAPDRTEMLASKDLDDLYQLAVGEAIRVTRSDGSEVELPVIGLAYNPMWDTYRNSQPPYVYVSEETLHELFPDRSTWDWSLGLRLEDPQAVDAMVERIESTLHADVVESYTDWRDVKQSAVFGAKINFIFLGAFSFFAILATVLVVASSIGSIVLSQFKQIGILKTIGFTGQQVQWLYLGQHLALSLIGSPVGMALGLALAPLPLRSVAVSLNTPFRPALNAPLVALVLSIIPGIVAAATLSAAQRGAKANIVRSIAVGAEAPQEKPSRGVRLATSLGLPMVLTLGLNEVFARPFRSFMTGLNLTLGVIGIVFGLTLNNTLDTYEQNPELLGVVYDAKVTRATTSDHKTRYLLNQAPGVEAFYAEHLVDVELPADPSRAFQMRAVEGGMDAFPFRVAEGRFLRPDSREAMAGRGLLDWLDLEVGDELTVAMEGRARRPITWRIVGQYPEPVNTGQMLMVSLPAVARWSGHVEPSTYYLKLSPDCPEQKLKRYLERHTSEDLNLTFVRETLPDAIFYLQLAIFALSAILIGIALINVFNTTLLAMQEKVRTIGILKTVGMTPAQVLTMVNTTAGALGLLATAIGLPLGFIFTKSLLANLSHTYGFGQVNVTLDILYVLLLIPLMIVVSIAGSVIPGIRASKVSIVNVLRSE
jgi:putative ABC transport system permease protein